MLYIKSTMLAELNFLIGWYTKNLSAGWINNERSSIFTYEVLCLWGKRMIWFQLVMEMLCL